MNRNLVVSHELTARVSLVNPLSLQFQANMPSKSLQTSADAIIVGLSDQVERMATSGFSPAMTHPGQDAPVFFLQSMGHDNKCKPHLLGVQKDHDWSFLLKKSVWGNFLVEEGECLSRY